MTGFTKADQLKKVKIKRVVVKSVPQLKKSVQKAVNKLVRLRDQNEPCMACQKPCKDEGDASHLVAQGSSGFLRYNLDNIWKCCTSCNRFKHGNLLEFERNLIKKIGKERVDYLWDHRNDTKQWKRPELEELLEQTKQRIKQYE